MLPIYPAYSDYCLTSSFTRKRLAIHVHADLMLAGIPPAFPDLPCMPLCCHVDIIIIRPISLVLCSASNFILAAVYDNLRTSFQNHLYEVN